MRLVRINHILGFPYYIEFSVHSNKREITRLTYYQKTMKYFDILKKLEKAGLEAKYVLILISVKKYLFTKNNRPTLVQ